MSDFDQPDLATLARSDRLLDALASRQPVESLDFAGPGDRALAALLADWRDESRWPPASGLVSEREALAALENGRAVGQRIRRGLRLLGSAAAAVLTLGGFSALVGGAQPGDALYGIHTMLFGEPPSVHDDRITLAAKTELEQVQQMITQGQWDQAQDKLAAVSNNVQTVNDAGRKQDLIDQVNRLNAKVANHDPNAPVPPASQPGVAPATTTTPVTPSEPMASTPPSPTASPTSSAPLSSADEATSTAAGAAPTSTAVESAVPTSTAAESPVPTSTVVQSATPTSVPPAAATAPPTSSTAPPTSSTVTGTEPTTSAG
ncbi:MAG: hypothetical protein J2P16_05905 [Mycobacterium sp.]|nr:hypothetical protein [Mycobacterium sp.]